MKDLNDTQPLGILLAGLLLAALAMGCTVSRPFVSKGSKVRHELVATSSAAHEFEFVRLHYDDGVLVLYGKVVHSHTCCAGGVHVDVAFYDSGGALIDAAGLPIVRRPSHLPGWRGAAFRSRFSQPLRDDATIRLAFHDSGCVAGDTFECGANTALDGPRQMADDEP